jgi:hypothetical protein
MKRFLKWTVAVGCTAIAGTFVFRAVQAGRQRVKNALGEAEAIAENTRATLEQTESALRTVRRAI